MRHTTEEQVRWDRATSGTGGNPAELYEEHLVPALFRPCAEALLDLAPPRPGDRVLDIACGTGAVALLVSERLGPGAEVRGIDLNPGMLAVARGRPGAGAIEWRQGDALDLPYEDGWFDLAYCQQSLQVIPRAERAVAEAARVLSSGGRFAVAVWGRIDRAPAYAVLERALERHAGSEAAGVIRTLFSLSEPADLASLLAAGGLADVRVETVQLQVRFPRIGSLVDPSLALLAAMGHAEITAEDAGAIADELASALASYREDEGFSLPMDTLLGVGVAG